MLTCPVWTCPVREGWTDPRFFSERLTYTPAQPGVSLPEGPVGVWRCFRLKTMSLKNQVAQP